MANMFIELSYISNNMNKILAYIMKHDIFQVPSIDHRPKNVDELILDFDGFY